MSLKGQSAAQRKHLAWLHPHHGEDLSSVLAAVSRVSPCHPRMATIRRRKCQKVGQRHRASKQLGEVKTGDPKAEFRTDAAT